MKRFSRRFTLVLVLFALAVLVAILASCGQNHVDGHGSGRRLGPTLAGLVVGDAAWPRRSARRIATPPNS